jgi:uncharacterized protein (TIGR03000 family)
MFRPSWKSLLIGTVMTAALAVAAAPADACWGTWGCYSPCCTTWYTPCCSACYDPCCYSDCGWYVGYRPGPIRRLLFGPYRWYYGGCGCYSSCCCDPCGWDVCCGGGVITTEAPGVPTAAAPTPAKKPEAETAPSAPTMEPGALPQEPSTEMPGPAPAAVPPAEPTTTDSTGVPTRENSGILTVYVPYDAKVTVNGLPTRSKGSRRQYVSYGLRPGFSYRYVVRAEVVRDGNPIEEIRTVVLTAGDQTAVAFGFNAEATGGLASR